MKHFLIAFDNIDHLIKDEYSAFLDFIKDMSSKTKVKFVFTSCRFLPGLFKANCGIKKL